MVLGHADELQYVECTRARFFGCQTRMHDQGFGHLVDDRNARVETPVGVLVDHLHRGALFAPALRTGFGIGFVFEEHRPFGGL